MNRDFMNIISQDSMYPGIVFYPPSLLQQNQNNQSQWQQIFHQNSSMVPGNQIKNNGQDLLAPSFLNFQGRLPEKQMTSTSSDLDQLIFMSRFGLTESFNNPPLECNPQLLLPQNIFLQLLQNQSQQNQTQILSSQLNYLQQQQQMAAQSLINIHEMKLGNQNSYLSPYNFQKAQNMNGFQNDNFMINNQIEGMRNHQNSQNNSSLSITGVETPESSQFVQKSQLIANLIKNNTEIYPVSSNPFSQLITSAHNGHREMNEMQGQYLQKHMKVEETPSFTTVSTSTMPQTMQSFNSNQNPIYLGTFDPSLKKDKIIKQNQLESPQICSKSMKRSQEVTKQSSNLDASIISFRDLDQEKKKSKKEEKIIAKQEEKRIKEKSESSKDEKEEQDLSSLAPHLKRNNEDPYKNYQYPSQIKNQLRKQVLKCFFKNVPEYLDNMEEELQKIHPDLKKDSLKHLCSYWSQFDNPSKRQLLKNGEYKSLCESLGINPDIKPLGQKCLREIFCKNTLTFSRVLNQIYRKFDCDSITFANRQKQPLMQEFYVETSSKILKDIIN